MLRLGVGGHEPPKVFRLDGAPPSALMEWDQSPGKRWRSMEGTPELLFTNNEN